MTDLSLSVLFGPGAIFRNAVLGGLLVTVPCALLGVYVALRRIVLVGVALPQVAAAGVTLAFWLTGQGAGAEDGAHALARLGALAATFGALGWLLPRNAHHTAPTEWRIGALLAVSMAATILFVALSPRGDLELTAMLRGDLLSIPDGDLRVLLASAATTLGVFALFRRELLLVSFDPEYARTIGFSTRRHDAMFFALLGTAIGLGVMAAGPLVVFGFLVLPPLSALRRAPSIGSALVVSIVLAAFSSLGGFALAVRADLPAGPSSVAVAAAAAATLGGVARLARLVRRWRAAMGAAILLLLATGCARAPGAPPHAPLRSGLSDLGAAPRVTVLRVSDETGESLRIPAQNPLRELARAAGDPFAERGETVADRLQAMITEALAKRGFDVVPAAQVRRMTADSPGDPARAASAARAAGIGGPVMQTTLHRFARTGTGLLFVGLDLALVEPESGRVVWRGRTAGPYPVPAAFTLDECLLDAADRLFAEAFGDG